MFREIEQDTTFDDLIEAIAPDGGPIAVLRAYFDASQRECGVFTVAGYLFDSAQARKFPAGVESAVRQIRRVPHGGPGSASRAL
jgi:hypothetical protein